MGQEFFETQPFLYFISHSDPELIKAVQKGRREEFNTFKWENEIPDPYDENTFERSKLQWEFTSDSKGLVIFSLYKKLINIRKSNPVFKENSRDGIQISKFEDKKIILLHRESAEKDIYCIINFEPETVTILADIPEGNWVKLLDTSDAEWLGTGTSTEKQLIGKKQNITLKRESFILYESE
jgi:maltooligosyltrehalose trehalohydrolase